MIHFFAVPDNNNETSVRQWKKKKTVLGESLLKLNSKVWNSSVVHDAFENWLAGAKKVVNK